jgi:hypothetical protein
VILKTNCLHFFPESDLISEILHESDRTRWPFGSYKIVEEISWTKLSSVKKRVYSQYRCF